MGACRGRENCTLFFPLDAQLPHSQTLTQLLVACSIKLKRLTLLSSKAEKFIITCAEGNPSCLQTTEASSTPHRPSLTVPHSPWYTTSTLPSSGTCPPLNLTEPSAAEKGKKGVKKKLHQKQKILWYVKGKLGR